MLRRVRPVLQRRGFIGVAAGLLVFAGACAYTAIKSPQFLSQAKLYVRLGRESAAVDPTAEAEKLRGDPESRVFEINSILDLLSSDEVRGRVVDELGAERILGVSENRRLGARGGAFLARSRINPFGSYSRREDAVRSLDKAIRVEVAKNSSVISLSCRAGSSQLAQEVLAALIEVLQQTHLRAKHSRGSQDFFAQQREAARQELRAREESLRQYREQTRLVDFPSQRQICLDQIAALEKELRAEEAGLASAKRELETCQKLLASLPRMAVVEETTGQAQTAADGMRQQLYALEMIEQQLRAKLHDEHVLMKQIAEQADRARNTLNAEPEKKQVRLGKNAVYEALEIRCGQAEVSAATLESKCGKLREQLAQARSELVRLVDQQVALAELERAAALAEERYREHARQYEQTRLDRELELQRISNISVVQPPTRTETPVSPNPRVTLPLGLLLGLCAGTWVAVSGRRIRWPVLPLAPGAEETPEPPETAERLAGHPTARVVRRAR